MAEAIAVIGTAGAVANIIDVLSNTISTIRELRYEWKEADLTFLCLVSQLTALRAALTKIKEWAAVDFADPHHQLVMDLDTSMSCCRILISKIDGQISELHQTPEERLDFSSKMIERQNKCIDITAHGMQLKNLLEKSNMRKVFHRIENDTESLVVHRDTASILSRCTDSLSKISIIFPFDGELFISKVYDRVIRGSLKEALRRQQGHAGPTEALSSQTASTAGKLAELKEPDFEGTEIKEVGVKAPGANAARAEISRAAALEAKKRSQTIDHRLMGDAKKLRREVKVLLLGSGDSGKENIIKQMVIHQNGGFSEEEQEMYRHIIYENVIDCLKQLIQAMIDHDIQPKQEGNKEYYKYLLKYSSNTDPGNSLDAKFGQAFSSIWHDQCIEELMEHQSEFHFMDSAPYFFEEIERIVAPNYIPTEADVLRAQTKSTGIHETRFTMGPLSIHLFDIGGQRSRREKYFHSFEGVHSIIFVVNLAEYDQVLLEESNQNRMMESLVFFESVVNSRYFTHTPIILILNNVDLFKQKLGRSPLGHYFPDYSGGMDANRAAKYILWHFNQLNRAYLNLYPHLVNPSDPSNIFATIKVAIEETILQSALRNMEKKKPEKKRAKTDEKENDKEVNASSGDQESKD